MKTKLTLNNREQQQYNLNLERLMSVGVIPREDKPSSEPQMLTVERTGGSWTALFTRLAPVDMELSFGCASSS